MIVVTGAAGFIGSCMVSFLNRKGVEDLIIVDDFEFGLKTKNLDKKRFFKAINRNNFIRWFEKNANKISQVIHLGARTDTTCFDPAIFELLNYQYSIKIAEICQTNQIPLYYASSAATYGDGTLGYDDRLHPDQLSPLNPYGISKNNVDLWMVSQGFKSACIGFKFYNVYGPNEYHKGRMASVIFHTHNQIQVTGQMTLFRSHRPDFKDGEQKRDFIYVKDILKVIWYCMGHDLENGLYNLGTGKARSFNDLARNTFTANHSEPNIHYQDTPLDIRNRYQYFTQADMSKLIDAGYTTPFYSLEDGIKDYVTNYLIPQKYY